MNISRSNIRENRRYASRKWGRLDNETSRELEFLSAEYGLQVERGELTLLGGHWYITHGGLLAVLQNNGCLGIETEPVTTFCDPLARRWVFRATIYKAPDSTKFVGFGDADPSNVSRYVSGAELRIAETRAVNRAIRKAFGIAVCSVDELSSSLSQPAPEQNAIKSPAREKQSRDGSPPRLRDRLCVLIKKYELDPELVKRYAASFCGTETVRDASKELVETFISSLSDQAEANREALVCKLNAFAPLAEVES
jgi:hypothetical protein